MATPTQQGTALKLLTVPTFSSFIVVDEKWEPTDSTGMEETIDNTGTTANFSFYNPGQEISFEWVIKSAGTAAAVGDVVTGSGTKFLVGPGLKTRYRGSKPAMQSGTLIVRDSVSLT